MELLLIPFSVKNLLEFKNWLAKHAVTEKTALGVREKCKITKLSQFSRQGPRWNTYCGIPIYFNF